MKIKMLTGVVEVGLFCDMAEAAYFGNAVGRLICSRMWFSRDNAIFPMAGWERDYQVARRPHRAGSSQLMAIIHAARLHRKASLSISSCPFRVKSCKE